MHGEEKEGGMVGDLKQEIETIKVNKVYLYNN